MAFATKTVRVMVMAGMLGGGGFAGAGVHLPVPYMSQPDGQTCLPTSFMMALNFMGRIDEFSSDTIQMLHKTCQYNRFNTPALAREFGLYALPNWHNLGWTRETVEHELDMGRPVVLGINSGRSGHFILAIGYTDDGRLIINNPTAAGASSIGGGHTTIDWSDIIWRGGIILRPTPFPEPPALSGVAVGRSGYPLESPIELRLTEGDDAKVSFTLVNNGRVAWPEELYLVPVDPDSSPTQALKSPLAEGWIAADRVTEALSGLDPETSGVVTFKVKAPEVSETETFLEYFQLVDGEGNWFGTSWLAGPGNRNMGVRMIVLPKDRPEVTLPLIGKVENGKPALPWNAKFGEVEILDSFTTAPPTGGAVARLLTPGHVSDAAWLGDPEMEDYRIEAWVWCEIREETTQSQGYERVGIFARDNGQHMADTKNEAEIGHCLEMAFDSDDGSLRAGNVYNGAIRDYREIRFHVKKSGWHHFSITCDGSTVSYELDGKPFHTEKNVRNYRKGECGVFYNGEFYSESPIMMENRGVIFSELKVTGP